MKRTERVKRIAYGSTLAAVGWMLFSLFGVFDWTEAHRSSHSLIATGALPDYAIWAVQLLLVLVAILAWRYERPRDTLWIETDPEFSDQVEACSEEETRGLMARYLRNAALNLLAFLLALVVLLRLSGPATAGLLWVVILSTLGGFISNLARYGRLYGILRRSSS